MMNLSNIYLAPFRSDTTSNEVKVDDKTTGHAAYGLFDVPSCKVGLTPLSQVPKGTGCTLVPTSESLRLGFSQMPDVKAALEQSLIRTRATLSVDDVVVSWYRRTKFELYVEKVVPSSFGVVSCINTDIEVDIGSPPLTPEEEQDSNSSKTKKNSHKGPRARLRW
jgi:Ubiquitin fusion degradation protein UFD1